jgi:hypothetical protein
LKILHIQTDAQFQFCKITIFKSQYTNGSTAWNGSTNIAFYSNITILKILLGLEFPKSRYFGGTATSKFEAYKKW